MSVMLCTGATFVKKDSCLVTRIVSFDNLKSWNSIFLNSEIFSFNSYVYYLTRAFSLLTRGFNLLTRAFNLPTRVFKLATHASSLLTRGFELITRRFELVTDNLCYTFPKHWHFKFIQRWVFHQQYFIAVSGILSFTTLRDLIYQGHFYIAQCLFQRTLQDWKYQAVLKKNSAPTWICSSYVVRWLSTLLCESLEKS